MKNPPAFPVPLSEYQTLQSTAANGMTLRDYFAAKAMQAQWTWFAAGDVPRPKDFDIAKWAYAQADAMLKAREE